jgi:hypothetical protein
LNKSIKMRLVVLTFGGRKCSLEILFAYIKRFKKHIHEYRIYVATTIKEDIDYMENFAKENSDFVKTVYLTVNNKVILDDREKIWDNAYKTCQEDDTVYLKMDDDIVFMDETLFTDFITYRLQNRSPPLLYPVIINNHIQSCIFERNGIYTPDAKSYILESWKNTYSRIKPHIQNNKDKRLRIGDFTRDNEVLCKNAWGNLKYCYDLHAQFLTDINAGNIAKYYLNENVILSNAEPVSINVCSWVGEDLRQIVEKYGDIYYDEPWLAIYLPTWSGRSNEIYAKTVVSHYSYYKQRELGLDRSNILNKYLMYSSKGTTTSIQKVIIWGFPLHTHTHSYIHYGWVKGFKHLGYDTYWFDDKNVPTNFDFNNCLFITEGYAETNIPIVETSIYFVHIARNPEKYIGKVKRFVEIRYLVDGIKDCNYNYVLNKGQCTKISDCTYHEKLHNNGGIAKHHNNPQPMEYECIYTCWATDLLPHEIVESNIYKPKDKCIYWFGSANHTNTKEINIFYNECVKNGIQFATNDPWRNPLPFDVVQEYTMKSIMSPDFRSSGDPNKVALGETGTCHKQIGYIACRLLKSISYGHLGITNSKHAFELLDKKVVYNSDEKQLFYDAVKHLQNYELIKEQMRIVRENHTYLNRIQDLLSVISLQ